jgi:hypothetical protein
MTVKKYITWVAPTSQEAFTHTEVWVSTNAGVTYTEFTTANDPNYTADGIVIANSYSVDKIGASGNYYKIRFYDNVGLVWSDYSEPMRGSDFRGYCSILDVRNYTNVQSTEYSDAAVQMMIDTVTATIDLDLNRTWQGVETSTDVYIDGNGRNYMFIDNDLQTVTSLAIAETLNGDFTVIPSNMYYLYKDKGAILLDVDADPSVFTRNRRSVKISYTHGFADPTDQIRMLCILRVANIMKMDNTRTAMIEDITKGLRVNSFENTEVGSTPDSQYG